jgi:hypothetical protein
MKQHPDCQPRRAVTMQSGNDDPGNDNYYFLDSEWIDGDSLGSFTLLAVRSSPMLNRAEREVK